MNVDLTALRVSISEHFSRPVAALGSDTRSLVEDLLSALEAGAMRAAYPEGGRWVVDPAVKQGILLAFRCGVVVSFSDPVFPFADKDTLPPRPWDLLAKGVRVVPGGSSIRAGAFLGRGVTVMPPAFVNVGAFVGDGTMVDSHALVGSCAQIGQRVHLSAGAQIGGVLEPVGQVPVVIEDDVLVGGNCGVYEGAWVRKGAVLASGTLLTASTPLVDLVHERVIRASPDRPLEVPEGAVVVPGSRAARGAFAEVQGIHLYAPVIVKYRDQSTDARVALEEALR